MTGFYQYWLVHLGLVSKRSLMLTLKPINLTLRKVTPELPEK